MKLALRQFLKFPGFSAAVVLTLALGIGANTTIFSIVNATFLRALPYAEPDRLVTVDERNPKGDEMSVSYPNFLDWRAQQDLFAGLALYRVSSAKLKTAEGAELISLGAISHEFFSVLGVNPMQGRAPTADDDREGAAPVAWLTHATWQKHFAGAADLIGRTVQLDDQPVSVAGILPADFRFHRHADAFVLIAPRAAQLFMTMRENHNDAYVIGRLRADATLAAAQAQMDTIGQRLEREYPKVNTGIRVHVAPLHERLAGWARTELLLLTGAVALVLLIACVNVANMLLARSFARDREMAIRTALGATRGQLLRQLLSESLVLACAGGVLGAVLSLWGVELTRRLVPWEIQALLDATTPFDARVLAFVAGVTLLTGIGFGLAPAWQLSHANPNDALKHTARTVRTSFGRVPLGDLLVVAQVALAVILLVGAGLLIRSLQRLMSVDPGIRPERILTLQVTPPAMEQFQRDPYSFATHYERMLGAVQSLPEIEAAAVTSSLPFTGSNQMMVFYRDGRPLPEPGEFDSASAHTVSADYFRALGIPLLRGRVFDGHEKQPVIPPGLALTPDNLAKVFQDVIFDGLVSQRMAETFWPGEDPIGKRFRLGYPDMQLPWVQIVGVVGNTTQFGLERGATPEFYLSLRQFPVPMGMHLAVRTRLEPAGAVASVRTAIHGIAPDQPIHDVKLMADRIAGFSSGRRFNMSLFTFFAGVALVLAVIGIYGVLAFAVSRRTREIGVRMALGAERNDVMRDVLWRGFRLVLPGVGLGLVGAWAVSRLLQSQLFGVTGTDPLTYLFGALLLLIAALLACGLPARRATRVNPVEALRSE